MTERVIIAGFGGQGVMLIGKLLAEVAMFEGKEVTFFPTYGTEVRGGTSNCHVVISEGEIFSPLVEQANSLIIMNQASYDKFKNSLGRDGVVFLNRSMILPDKGCTAPKVEIPATEIAGSLGDVRVSNMVMMGAYNSARNVVKDEDLLGHLKRSLSKKKSSLFGLNKRAFIEGKNVFQRSGLRV